MRNLELTLQKVLLAMAVTAVLIGIYGVIINLF